MSPERFARIKEVLARRQPDLAVVMEDVHKPHNLSAIARSCDAVGVPAVHAVAPAPDRGDQRLNHRAASGSERWVETIVHASLDTAVAALRRAGMQIVAADPTPEARDFTEVDYCRPTALLVGSELEGLSDAARAASDIRIRIPLLGMVSSLNVSVASALILFEARRQRMQAGMYAEPRLPDSEYRERVFEWAYPEIARWCRRRGRPYPELSPRGDIVEPLTDNAVAGFAVRAERSLPEVR